MAAIANRDHRLIWIDLEMTGLDTDNDSILEIATAVTDGNLELLASIGLRNVTVAGDTRIDRVSSIAQTKKDIPLAATFKADTPLLVVGSAWQGDLDLLLPLLNSFTEPLKVMIAPHEIREETLQHIEKTLNKKTIRRFFK